MSAIPRSCIFIYLLPGVARRCAIQWVLGVTFLSADLIALIALWEAPTSLYYKYTFDVELIIMDVKFLKDK
jgi:hypothetical protein